MYYVDLHAYGSYFLCSVYFVLLFMCFGLCGYWFRFCTVFFFSFGVISRCTTWRIISPRRGSLVDRCAVLAVRVAKAVYNVIPFFSSIVQLMDTPPHVLLFVSVVFGR